MLSLILWSWNGSMTIRGSLSTMHTGRTNRPLKTTSVGTGKHHIDRWFVIAYNEGWERAREGVHWNLKPIQKHNQALPKEQNNLQPHPSRTISSFLCMTPFYYLSTKFHSFLSPQITFLCSRHLCRVTWHVQVNKRHVIWHWKSSRSIHKQGRLHCLGSCRIGHWSRTFRSAWVRSWQTGKLYVIHLVSKVFIFPDSIHLWSGWDKGARPIFPSSLVTLIVVVKHIIMISRCKLHKTNIYQLAWAMHMPNTVIYGKPKAEMTKCKAHLVHCVMVKVI